MQEIRSSNPPVVTGICDLNKSRSTTLLQIVWYRFPFYVFLRFPVTFFRLSFSQKQSWRKTNVLKKQGFLAQKVLKGPQILFSNFADHPVSVLRSFQKNFTTCSCDILDIAGAFHALFLILLKHAVENEWNWVKKMRKQTDTEKENHKGKKWGRINQAPGKSFVQNHESRLDENALRFSALKSTTKFLQWVYFWHFGVFIISLNKFYDRSLNFVLMSSLRSQSEEILGIVAVPFLLLWTNLTRCSSVLIAEIEHICL